MHRGGTWTVSLIGTRGDIGAVPQVERVILHVHMNVAPIVAEDGLCDIKRPLWNRLVEYDERIVHDSEAHPSQVKLPAALRDQTCCKELGHAKGLRSRLEP
jgi:hypothetical protein